MTPRAAAKASNQPTYFTGKPCLYGGIALRRTSTGSCVCDICLARACEKVKAYYAINVEERKSYSKEYKRKNKDKISDEKKANRDNNKETIAKYQKQYAARYYAKNKDRILAKNKAYLEQNIDARTEYARRYYEQNRPKLLKRAADWAVDNKHRVRVHASLRRASVLQRTPTWFGEFDVLVIEEAERIRVERQRLFGGVWHIDHMIPLRSIKASGLHTGTNLQVIPQRLNVGKGNRMRLTEVGEWLRQI